MQEPLSVDDKIALSDAQIRVEEQEQRKEMAKAFQSLFVGLNIIVLIIVIILLFVDQYNITRTMPIDRLVTTEVLMSLIGATTVQLGTIMLTIANYVFPKSK